MPGVIRSTTFSIETIRITHPNRTYDSACIIRAEHDSEQIPGADPRQAHPAGLDALPPQHGTHRRDHGLRDLEDVELQDERCGDPAGRGVRRDDRRSDRAGYGAPCGPSLPPGFSELLRRCAERLRLGLPQEHQGREVHREGGVHLLRELRGQDAASRRSDACHGIVAGADLRGAVPEGRDAAPYARGVGHSQRAGARLCDETHAAPGHDDLGGRRRRGVDVAGLHRPGHRGCRRPGLRGEDRR